MMSLTMEYALRAVVFLSERAVRSCAVHEIAGETQVPADYLSKVMLALCRAGLVNSRPGRNGGYVLGRDPGDMTLLDVIEAVEPLRLIESCPLNKPCHKKQLCPLHRALRSATEAFSASLRTTTVRDLCPNQDPAPPTAAFRLSPSRTGGQVS